MINSLHSAHDRIYKSVSVTIDIKCEYDNVYNDIEAGGVVVAGDNIEVDADKGEGKFSFTLTQYKDGNLTEPLTENDKTKIGGQLHFQLTMENPVASLVYSLVGKIFSLILWYLEINSWTQPFNSHRHKKKE